jgi:hypothetical protein
MYYGMLGNALWKRLSENLVAIGRNTSGLMVGTNLGTTAQGVQTLAIFPCGYMLAVH